MRLRAFAILAALIVVLLPTSPAAQSRTPFDQGVHGAPVRVNPCFQEFLTNLLSCRDAFCVGDNCNQELLSACIRGARQTLDVCLDSDR